MEDVPLRLQFFLYFKSVTVNICVQVCEHMFSTHLGKYQGVELQDYMVRVHSIL